MFSLGPGGEIIYFEMDHMGQLLELAKKDMEGDVQAMDLAPVPPGLLRCKFLAVGSFDQTVRILSLEDGTQLRPMATQAVHVGRGSHSAGGQEGMGAGKTPCRASRAVAPALVVIHDT